MEGLINWERAYILLIIQPHKLIYLDAKKIVKPWC